MAVVAAEEEFRTNQFNSLSIDGYDFLLIEPPSCAMLVPALVVMRKPGLTGASRLNIGRQLFSVIQPTLKGGSYEPAF